jgi:hypothetical protein
MPELQWEHHCGTTRPCLLEVNLLLGIWLGYKKATKTAGDKLCKHCLRCVLCTGCTCSSSSFVVAAPPHTHTHPDQRCQVRVRCTRASGAWCAPQTRPRVSHAG